MYIVNVPLTRFKVLLKQYLSSNILTISYHKKMFNDLSKHPEISFILFYFYISFYAIINRIY